MSHCEVYAIRPSGDMEWYGAARNAWGGAMQIWLACARRLGLVDAESGGAGLLLGGTLFALWGRVHDLPEGERWVMLATFDRVLIGRAALPTYLGHLRAFAGQHPTGTLRELVAILDRALADETVRGIGFNQMSVVAPFWAVATGDGETVRPYNVDRDAAHWWIDGVAG